MEINKQIAKALLNKSFAEAKELVFKSLYAKASLALDEARFAVSNAVFNEAAKTTGVPAGASEDKFTAARAEIKKAGHKAKLGKGVPAGSMKEEAEQIDEAGAAKLMRLAKAHDKAKYGSTRAGITNPEKAKRLGDAYSKMKDKVQAKQRKRNFAPASAFGMKEEVDQLDEVSPPGMEKMTGSKKTKASFAKQYGKRGKSVMYATAWKLHNKKAKD